VRQQRLRVGAAQHQRQWLRALGARHVVQPRELGVVDIAVEEQDRRQRLVLGAGADVARGGQVRKEVLDVRRLQLPRVPAAVVPAQRDDPAPIGFLGARGIVLRTDARDECIAELERLLWRGVDRGEHGFSLRCYATGVSRNSC